MTKRTLSLALAGAMMLAMAVSDVLAAGSNRTSAGKSPAAVQPVEPPLQLDRFGNPVLGSAAFVIASQKTGDIIAEKASGTPVPIASITKLMTAMVVLDARQSLKDVLTISNADIDRLKGTSSRLSIGTRLTREEMLHLALMSSENRAASALARYYPGGAKAFIEAMNVKARMLGLWDTRFADSTGLNPRNVSSPRDLVNLVQAAATYPLIREFSTADERYVRVGNGMMRFGNSNGLVRDPEWQVSVSKTGYIREAGRCLVMQTWVRGEPVIMVLMGSEGRYTRTADAKRVKRWLETSGGPRLAALAAARGGG
ncbi:MAG: serine hydrolase [Rhodocyclaceae bacterium]|jgi:D-alanyl-D-alanine endopeptidase (penicillin-binding protein 7)|nr:serine hydrolase [Rhodocyclaceae bacterium]